MNFGAFWLAVLANILLLNAHTISNYTPLERAANCAVTCTNSFPLFSYNHVVGCVKMN